MDFEQEIRDLKDLARKQQNQITDLDTRLKGLNDELGIVDDEMNRPGKDGYTSLYDVKEKLIEKGWLKKP